jgi:hypothetical protein
MLHVERFSLLLTVRLATMHLILLEVVHYPHEAYPGSIRVGQPSED